MVLFEYNYYMSVLLSKLGFIINLSLEKFLKEFCQDLIL